MKIEALPKIVGVAASWLTTILVVIIFVDVVRRYLFDATAVWMLDLEWHLFAAVFLLGAAYTLGEDKHVRVDVFYNNFSKKKKAWINIIGTVFLLIPWALLIVTKSFNYAMNSWYIREGSAEPDGLGARYIIKFVIVIGFILLLIQAFTVLYKNIRTLRT
ncbi:MAG: TRAP transporter small permease subunit [Saprospiraceae bacterium]|nr:TRAP transporter small permease subunit [Saprospiraceae bacterium]